MRGWCINMTRKNPTSHLSEDLREEYGTRSVPIRSGDEVKVVRGDFEGISGEVRGINDDGTINVDDVEIEKGGGETVFYPLDASNVMITSLDLNDDEREKMLGRKGY